jgi:Ca2+-binding RTX toxin-like protein
VASISRRFLTVALPTLGLLAAPAVAGAATNVDVRMISGLKVVVAENDDAASVIDATVSVETGDPSTTSDDVPFVAVQSSTGATPGTGCIATPNPNIVGCEGKFDAILVAGNGGNDKITLDLFVNGVAPETVPPPHGEAYGDAGEDEIQAPPDGRVGIAQPTTYLEGNGGNDRLISGNGEDEVLGGDGNDTIESNRGADTIRGEAGDDSLSAGKEEPEPNVADVVDGGPGNDRIADLVPDYGRGFDDDVSITLDNQANDGEPGEGDNVIAVEKFNIVANFATVVGTDAAEDVFVESNGSSVKGLGGNDRLVTYDGNDSIEGGAGDDFLQAGFGNDTLDGGPGTDQFLGDRTESNVFAVGNDTINAIDGNSEQIDCGIGGGDIANADVSDVVSSSCEQVNRGTVCCVPPDGNKFGPKTLVTLRLASARIPAGGPLRVRIANANPFTVTGSVGGQTASPVTVSAKRIVKLRAKRFSVSAGARKVVKLKLPAAMKRTLRRTGKLTLKMAVKVKDPAGTRRTVRKKITARLKR